MLLAATAALAGAGVQSATGFGFAMLLSPALFAVLDPREALGALLVLGLLLNLLILVDGGLGPVQGRALAPLLLAALPGLLLGVALLSWFSKSLLQVLVGIAVLLAAGSQARIRSRGAVDRGGAVRTRRPTASHTGATLVGFASGALTTSVGISGPPLLLWLEARGLRPAEVRASLSAAFLALNLLGVAVIVAGDGLGSVDLPMLLPLLVLVVAGHVAGAVVFRRLPARAFSRLGLALVTVAGAASIAAGLAAS